MYSQRREGHLTAVPVGTNLYDLYTVFYILVKDKEYRLLVSSLLDPLYVDCPRTPNYFQAGIDLVRCNTLAYPFYMYEILTSIIFFVMELRAHKHKPVYIHKN